MRKNPTVAEALVWKAIRKKYLGAPAKRQRVIRGYIVDFYVPAWKLVIEVDGSSHDAPAQKVYDAKREAVIRGLGFEIIRFKNE